jgi:hypothetical protein
VIQPTAPSANLLFCGAPQCLVSESGHRSKMVGRRIAISRSPGPGRCSNRLRSCGVSWAAPRRNSRSSWENYRGDEMYVSRSIRNGRISDPRTRKGRAPAPVTRQPADRLKIRGLRCGSPVANPNTICTAVSWQCDGVGRRCRTGAR